jgi:hypothetical protein
LSHLFLSPEQLAEQADNHIIGNPAWKPLEKLAAMLRYIERYHYHIVAVDIQEACRRRVGL